MEEKWHKFFACEVFNIRQRILTHNQLLYYFVPKVKKITPKQFYIRSFSSTSLEYCFQRRNSLN